jgi:hypothetical protein
MFAEKRVPMASRIIRALKSDAHPHQYSCFLVGTNHAILWLKEERTMAQRREAVAFDAFLTNAASIFDQIEREGKSVLVEHDGALFTVKMKRPKTTKGSRALTSQDSILHIIGIAASQGPLDTSTNKHRYLADAAGDLHGA